MRYHQQGRSHCSWMFQLRISQLRWDICRMILLNWREDSGYYQNKIFYVYNEILLYFPSWSCTKIYFINRFTSLCKNLFNLLECLAEAFRCHVHHFECLRVPNIGPVTRLMSNRQRFTRNFTLVNSKLFLYTYSVSPLLNWNKFQIQGFPRLNFFRHFFTW